MRSTQQSQRADFGLDAPGVVRNLFLVGASGLIFWLTVVTGLWSGQIGIFDVSGTGLGFFFGFTGTAAYMVWGSRVGKIRDRDRLLNRISWRGDEQVLDVGCGRGLFLIGAAHRLTTGKATGIDIWQTEDLSGNRPEATIENAQREGVADRVSIKTADMRQMPFDGESFDVVVSSWAIHNLYDPKDRDQAIKEIIRVLKPNGTVLIKDIRHAPQYANMLRAHGCSDVRRIDSRLASILATMITFGSVRPGVLIAHKAN